MDTSSPPALIRTGIVLEDCQRPIDLDAIRPTPSQLPKSMFHELLHLDRLTWLDLLTVLAPLYLFKLLHCVVNVGQQIPL